MGTSKIRIRPFIPSMKDESKDDREPFAVLKYGNVSIELDYTIMCMVKLDCESAILGKVTSIANAAFGEVVHEMHNDMYRELPQGHRDSKRYEKLVTHYPLHPINDEVILMKGGE